MSHFISPTLYDSDQLIARIIATAEPDHPDLHPIAIVRQERTSNEVFFISFRDRRPLVIKRLETGDRHESIHTTPYQEVSTRLHLIGGIRVPTFLDLKEVPQNLVCAYWHLPEPTAAEIWPVLKATAQIELITSMGWLLHRIHSIPVDSSLRVVLPQITSEYLITDLSSRLIPAIETTYPEARKTALRLRKVLKKCTGKVDAADRKLVHTDYHMRNILCHAGGEKAWCTGIIDLDHVALAPVELDVAHMQILHGDLFGQPLYDGWLTHFFRGYPDNLCPTRIALFKVLRLLNLGYHARFMGFDVHSRDVAELAGNFLQELESHVEQRHRTPYVQFQSETGGS